MKVDAPVVKAEETRPAKRYVGIPETDLFDMIHPTIHINHMAYGPGTHYVDNAVADTLENRLKAYARGNARLLQPRPDSDAERLVSLARGSSGTATTNF